MTDSNRGRIDSLSRRGAITAKFSLGQSVREPYGEVGVIDAIFADLEAAHDKSCSDAEPVVRGPEAAPENAEGWRLVFRHPSMSLS